MNFEQGPEQLQLAESIARYIERKYDFDTRKKIINLQEACSAEIWRDFAEMGVLGLPFPEEYGGFGWGATQMMGVMQLIGAGLVLEPYLSTVGLAAQFISRMGSPEQKSSLLPAVAEGRLKMAFAHVEHGARYDLSYVQTQAKAEGSMWRINGQKCVVLHAPCADRIIVSARTSRNTDDATGISLFLVDPSTFGVTLKPYRTVDNMAAAHIDFRNVTVGEEALIGPLDRALPWIEEVTDFATALLTAEAVGVMKYANEQTLEYLKTRKQFGVLIGSFQALQHRMVDMTISYEQAYSMACLACVKADSESDASSRARTVSAAKIRIADACRQIRHEAVQLHGGIGMTEELKLSHAFRRLLVIAQQFGDTAYHLERYAALS